MPKLTIGSGDTSTEKVEEKEGVEVQRDLNQFPWSFRDNFFSEINIIGTLEHQDSVIETMDEIHRICKDGAKVTIQVPFFNNAGAHADPITKNFFTFGTFEYFTREKNEDILNQGKGYDYTNKYFKIINIIGKSARFGKCIPNWKFPVKMIKKNSFMGIRDVISLVLGEIVESLIVELEVEK